MEKNAEGDEAWVSLETGLTALPLCWRIFMLNEAGRAGWFGWEIFSRDAEILGWALLQKGIDA